jgi:cytochrome c peroxidase
MRKGAFPQFTDFGFAAIGAPRNANLPANSDLRYYDLGLCGPLRSDLADRKEYCGLFRTPSLRNAATRRAFFHNGVLHRLEDVVRFYAERDARPQNWYPLGLHGVLKFDDLPLQYHGNLDTLPPFDRHIGDAPALSEAEIRDIVAFLNALTDGYREAGSVIPPPAPESSRLQRQSLDVVEYHQRLDECQRVNLPNLAVCVD